VHSWHSKISTLLSWAQVNHYPGLAVDVPTTTYSYFFEPNPNWSRLFAPGQEIQRYLRTVAQRVGLYAHLHTGAEVVRQTWDDGRAVWQLELTDGRVVTARFVISAVGGYINAKQTVPITGIADFRGPILRPNDWDDGVDVRGKRVAVIGTGSSGV